MPDHSALEQLEKDVGKLTGFLTDLNDRLSAIEHRNGYVSSAFPYNDLGKPDYDGHRKSHLQQIADAKIVEGFKVDAAKKVMGIIITVLLTIIGSGLVATLSERLK